jgi:hypothetical protein
MAADAVARARDNKLLREEQFKPKGNIGMSDSVGNRSKGMTTPTSEWQDSKAVVKKPKKKTSPKPPPQSDSLF